MSTGFKIRGGDLVVGTGRAFERVSGHDKLFQDLTLWILERIGTDPATPTYGSTLDGGVINGREVESMIGQIGSIERVAEIRLEVLSLIERYQQEQIAKMQQEMILFRGQHTLSADELLDTIDSVEAKLVGSTVVVRVSCTTLSGTTFKITVPVQA